MCFECMYISLYVGDFCKENITNTDKPLHKDKDVILKDKSTDTVEDCKYTSKRSCGAIMLCILCIWSTR